MHTVSLFIEILRVRPLALFWSALITQLALWTLVPTLFYTAPPGGVAELLAVGHEFQLGTDFGPPLAFWLGELAYMIGGFFGIYLLSQICVGITFWAVFSVGRVIVGDRQATMAVLLMVGIAAFTVPTTDFGPSILATALWALALLHYWLAVGEGRRSYWFVLGLDAGLLVLTSYSALILVGLLMVFTLLNERGRAQFSTIDPWVAGIIAVMIVFPHLIWFDQSGGVALAGAAAIDQNVRTWARVIAALLIGHFGVAILVGLANGFWLGRRGPAPEIIRAPLDPMARTFVYFFAVVPAAAMLLLTLFTRRPESFLGTPLIVFSGLAVIVAAGERIRIYQQRLTALAWIGLLVAPPLIVATAVVFLPWTLIVDLPVAQPATEMGRFFADSFQRRTGRPLEVVAGNQRTAALVALTAPSRPSLYLDATPERSSWMSRQDIDDKGAIVVWPTEDTDGTPPPGIKERFPDIVPEVPRAFERRFQGLLPLIRIGWAVIRPREAVTVEP
jgi:4-amino-4-deoxy-L-arabinose transferase-like glycosyltransferase